jgi:chaperonin GroEL (HSP60 family)
LQLVHNHGAVHPLLALEQAQAVGRGHGFDAERGQIVPMVESGIIDSLPIVRASLASAVSAAGTAITTDMIVLRARN